MRHPVQPLQILTNDDEVENWRLSSCLLAVRTVVIRTQCMRQSNFSHKCWEMLLIFRQLFLGLAINSRWMWILVYACTVRTYTPLTHAMISQSPNNAWWKPNEPKSTFRWFPNDVATTKFGHDRSVGMSLILGGTHLHYEHNRPHCKPIPCNDYRNLTVK